MAVSRGGGKGGSYHQAGCLRVVSVEYVDTVLLFMQPPCMYSEAPTNWRDVPLEESPPDQVLVLPQSNPAVCIYIIIVLVSSIHWC